MDWPLAQIRAKVRALTGRPSTNQISDSDLNEKINDFYVNIFPAEIGLPNAEGWYTFTTTATDGEYDVPEHLLMLKQPITIDDGDGDVVDPLTFYRDRDAFFDVYPEDSNAAENQPVALLMTGELFYPRPVPDNTYTIKGWGIMRPVTELSSSVDSLQANWGPAIAYGTAIQIKTDDRDTAAVQELNDSPFGYQYHLTLIERKEIQRLSGLRAKPAI